MNFDVIDPDPGHQSVTHRPACCEDPYSALLTVCDRLMLSFKPAVTKRVS